MKMINKEDFIKDLGQKTIGYFANEKPNKVIEKTLLEVYKVLEQQQEYEIVDDSKIRTMVIVEGKVCHIEAPEREMRIILQFLNQLRGQL